LGHGKRDERAEDHHASTPRLTHAVRCRFAKRAHSSGVLTATARLMVVTTHSGITILPA
jgi:hypothetical protein